MSAGSESISMSSGEKGATSVSQFGAVGLRGISGTGTVGWCTTGVTTGCAGAIGRYAVVALATVRVPGGEVAERTSFRFFSTRMGSLQISLTD
jgi:hypothetical protein